MPQQRRSLQQDLDTLSRALIRSGRPYASPHELAYLVNVALVFAGVRGAARIEIESAAFFRTLRGLMRRHHPHLRLVRWSAHRREPILMDARDPQNVRDMDQIKRALRERGGPRNDREPVVTEPMGRLLGYLCPYRDSERGTEWDSAGSISLCAVFADGSFSDLAGFGCSKMDLGSDPAVARVGMDRVIVELKKQWLEPANAALRGARLLPVSMPESADRVISHFCLQVTRPGRRKREEVLA